MISLVNSPDFDSAIRRFDPSRPSQHLSCCVRYTNDSVPAEFLGAFANRDWEARSTIELDGFAHPADHIGFLHSSHPNIYCGDKSGQADYVLIVD